MADNTIKATGQAEDVIRLDRPFDYEGYQVVRQEFFAHVNEPAITFNNYKFYGNAACLRKFPDTEFVQVLINRERKLLVLRPCGEEDRDAFPWRTQKSKKPKQATCRLFFAKVFELMEWNPAHRIHICRNVVKVTGEDILVKEPKTAAGDRYVYFSLEMASLLKEYRSFCEGELELHEGRSLTPEDYIFRRHGADLPMTPSTFTWRFKLILKKHGLPLDLNVHSLRHTAASLMISGGADVATVSGLLGHSQVSTTLDIYTHAFDEKKREVSAQMQGRVGV